MSARQKLNSVYVVGIGFLSGFIGLVTQSWIAFIICFAILAAGLLHDGSLRLKPTRR